MSSIRARVHVVGIVSKAPAHGHAVRHRVVRRSVRYDKPHAVQLHHRLGRAAEVFLLPLGVKLGHRKRRAAPEDGISNGLRSDGQAVPAGNDGAAPKARFHGRIQVRGRVCVRHVPGAAPKAGFHGRLQIRAASNFRRHVTAAAKEVVAVIGRVARRIRGGVGHVPQGRRHGPFDPFSHILCVGLREQLDMELVGWRDIEDKPEWRHYDILALRPRGDHVGGPRAAYI